MQKNFHKIFFFFTAQLYVYSLLILISVDIFPYLCSIKKLILKSWEMSTQFMEIIYHSFILSFCIVPLVARGLCRVQNRVWKLGFWGSLAVSFQGIFLGSLILVALSYAAAMIETKGENLFNELQLSLVNRIVLFAISWFPIMCLFTFKLPSPWNYIGAGILAVGVEWAWTQWAYSLRLHDIHSLSFASALLYYLRGLFGFSSFLVLSNAFLFSLRVAITDTSETEEKNM